MPLESASFINGLDANNPAGGDSLSQADDHLRLIKATIKATFPNVTGAVTPTQAQFNQLASGTVATLDGTQTLTNKSLTSPTLTGTVTFPGGSFSGVSATFGAITTSGVANINNTLNVAGGANVTNGITATAAGFQPLLLNRTGGASVLLQAFQNDGVTRGWLGANSTYPFFASLAGGGSCIYADTAGNFTAVGNVTAYSDARLKSDVVTFNDALGVISELRGVRYVRNDTGMPRVGLIAQEVREVLPEVVLGSEEELGMYLSVSYGDIVGVLVEAVKELKERVEALEEEARPSCL
jgi:hypothetical protein